MDDLPLANKQRQCIDIKTLPELQEIVLGEQTQRSLIFQILPNENNQKRPLERAELT